MAGDNQMDPAELEVACLPVVRGEVDYHKANRLFTGQAWDLIPRNRYLGNAVLSLLTKVASGYWHVADSQAGYAAISLPMLRLLDLDRIYKRVRLPQRHPRPPERLERAGAGLPVAADLRRRRALGDQDPQGRPADLLAAREGLLLAAAREVRDPRLPPARLLLHVRVPAHGRSASRSGIYVAVSRIFVGGDITAGTAALIALLLISGSQFSLFAMWFDMESNKDLR